MPFCEQCGGTLEEGAKFCEHCGASVGAGTPPASSYTPPHPDIRQAPVSRPPMTSEQKNPVLAALASLLIAGLGQTYNGSLLKGLGLFIAVMILSQVDMYLGLAGLGIGIAEAFMTAKKMNDGNTPYIPHSILHIGIHIVAAIIIVFILISLYSY